MIFIYHTKIGQLYHPKLYIPDKSEGFCDKNISQAVQPGIVQAIITEGS
ncbi:MAG: hypothetical protein ABIN94_19785 [Ferruginibacter sp.]